MNNWIKVVDVQPVVNEFVLICEMPIGDSQPHMAVSYWDGSFDEYKGHKLYKFPDGQDEQPGYYYPQYWMALPKPPID